VILPIERTGTESDAPLGTGTRARLRPCPDGRNSDAEDTRRVKGREGR
jgi:hypothetical protein